MKMKCYWENGDIVGGKLVARKTNDSRFMIISRGLGEGEYNLAALGNGEVVLPSFAPRKGMARFLTDNDYEPLQGET